MELLLPAMQGFPPNPSDAKFHGSARRSGQSTSLIVI